MIMPLPMMGTMVVTAEMWWGWRWSVPSAMVTKAWVVTMIMPVSMTSVIHVHYAGVLIKTRAAMMVGRDCGPGHPEG